MTQAKHRWSYSAGEWGRNRVCAFEHPTTGKIFLEFRERGRRKRIALGHQDRDAAKKKTEEVALALREPETLAAKEATLQSLFDNYLREVTPRKGVGSQQHDRSAAKLFLRLFGGSRKVGTLNRRDWDRYIAWRRGASDHSVARIVGKPVGNRVVTLDLTFLRSVCNWALAAADHEGRPLLARNPLHGLSYPKEDTPRRPILNEEQYQAILTVSPQVDAAFELAVVLANETGHRIGAIRMLRWSDIDFEGETIRWRASHDKIGFEHRTPMTTAALAALQRRRKAYPSIGDTWVFPAPENPTEPCSKLRRRDWWLRGEELAGIVHQPGMGWHSLRRKFATELKHVPLKDLCHLGGWKEPQTILKCYQRADTATMKEGLASRRHLVSLSL